MKTKMSFVGGLIAVFAGCEELYGTAAEFANTTYDYDPAGIDPNTGIPYSANEQSPAGVPRHTTYVFNPDIPSGGFQRTQNRH